MSRTLTAMFDSRSEAETVREQLRQIGATAEIRDQSHLGSSGSSGSGSSSGGYNNTYGSSGASGMGQSDRNTGSSSGSGGFWSELKEMFVSDEDRPSYEEGVRRGGFLLTAHVDESRADEACDILERGGSVDLDAREQSWRSEGWQGYQGSSRSNAATGQRALGSETGNSDRIVEEEHIPIIEEQLRVGKREVSRGGARVRSYVEETPVNETVNLREEHVHVERRPVDQPLTGAALNDAFGERSVEMRETAEEAVVAKEARVKEELVVSKTANERTEQIHDTVRHTEVDVDENMTDSDRGSSRQSDDRGAFGFDRDKR